jgi:hypothetical protein
VSDNNCTLTKSRGAIGSRVQVLFYYLWYRRYNEYEAEGAGILYTILLILETILIEALSSEGEDYLDNEGRCSSRGRRRIFHCIR